MVFKPLFLLPEFCVTTYFILNRFHFPLHPYFSQYTIVSIFYTPLYIFNIPHCISISSIMYLHLTKRMWKYATWHHCKNGYFYVIIFHLLFYFLILYISENYAQVSIPVVWKMTWLTWFDDKLMGLEMH